MFSGAFVALITPFRNGQLDEPALRKLVEFQCNSAIDGLVICASIGEGFTLTAEEHQRVVAIVSQEVNGRLPIIASVSSYTPAHTLQLAVQAMRYKIDGIMVLTPPYIKPSSAALEHYFTYIHDQTNIPIMLYDNPGRGSVVIEADVIARLAKLPRIVALKDASGDIMRPAYLRTIVPENFVLLSGDDATVLAFMAHGGQGVISGSANIIPDLVRQQITLWHEKNFNDLAKLRNRLLPVHQIMYYEPSSAVHKYVCSLFSLCTDEVRLPLQPLTLAGQQKVKAVLSHAQIISL